MAALPQGTGVGKAERVPLSVFNISRAPPAPEPKLIRRPAEPIGRDLPVSKSPLQAASTSPPGIPTTAPPKSSSSTITPPLIRLPSHPPVMPPTAPSPAPLKRDSDARNVYSALLWKRIAERRPKGLHLPGAATLVFTLDEAGQLKSVSVQQSSGSRLLDRIAAQTVRRAAPFPAPPAGLGDLTFSVSFHFD
jgi:protein TonB